MQRAKTSRIKVTGDVDNTNSAPVTYAAAAAAAVHTQEVYLFLYPVPKEDTLPYIRGKNNSTSFPFNCMDTQGCYSVSTTMIECILKWCGKERMETLNSNTLNIFFLSSKNDNSIASKAINFCKEKIEAVVGSNEGEKEKERFFGFFNEVVKARLGNATGVKAAIETCIVGSVIKKNSNIFSPHELKEELLKLCQCSSFLARGLICRIVFNSDPLNHPPENENINKDSFLRFLHEIAPALEEPSIIAIIPYLCRELPPRYRMVFRYITGDHTEERNATSAIMDWKVEEFPVELQSRVRRLFYSALNTVSEFKRHGCTDDDIWGQLSKRFVETGYTYPFDRMEELEEFLVTFADKKNTPEVLETLLKSPFFTQAYPGRQHCILLKLASRQIRLSTYLEDMLSKAIKYSYRFFTPSRVDDTKKCIEFFYYCATEWADVFKQCPRLLEDVVASLPGAGVGGTDILQEALIFRARAVLYEDRDKGIDTNLRTLRGALWTEESKCIIDLMKYMDEKEGFIGLILMKDRNVTHPEILSEIFVSPIANELEKSLRTYDYAPDNKRNMELASVIFPQRGDVCNFLVNETALKLLESAVKTLKMKELEKFDSSDKKFIEDKDREVRNQLDTLLYRSTKKMLTLKQFRCMDNNRIILTGLKQMAKHCNMTEEFQRMDQDRVQVIQKMIELRKVSEVARKVANQLQVMRVLPQVEDRIRLSLTAEQEKEDSLTLEEVERQHEKSTAKKFSLEVDGICPGYQSSILQYFELKSADTTEVNVVPPVDSKITDLIDIFTDFYKKCVVVPLQDFWKRLSERTITAAELSDVLNINVFANDVKDLAEIVSETERETFELRVAAVQEHFINGFVDEMRWFSTAFKITHQEDIRHAIKSYLDFCTNYRNFEAFEKLANLLHVEKNVDFSPILMENYSNCEKSLMDIVKTVDHTRAAFSLVFRTPPCYTRRLYLCMTRGLPEALSKFLDFSDYTKKNFENTYFSTRINDKISEASEEIQLLLDFKMVIQTMFTASREVLKGLSERRVEDAKKLQEFLCNSAMCDTALSNIEQRFHEISAMHGRQEVESAKAEANRVIEKGEFTVAEENGVITFFAAQGGSKYSQDRLEEWATQFICSQTQNEVLDDGKRSNNRIFYTFPIVVGHLQKICNVMDELRSIGHPLVNDIPKAFPGNTSSGTFEEIIDMLHTNLQKWRSIVDSARMNHPLLYLCPRPLLQRLYMAMNNLRITPLTLHDLSALREATLQPESNEFPNDINVDARECLRKNGEDTMGAVAELVFKNFNREAFKSSTTSLSPQLLYCVESHELELPSDEVLLYVVSLFWHQCSRLPLPVEMLVCSSQTTTLEIEDFIGCWYNWVGHADTWCPHGDSPYFCIVNAQLLSRPVQDALVQRVVRYGAKDIDDDRPLLAIFATKQSTISFQLRQSDPVRKEKQSANYKTYIKEVKEALNISNTVCVVYSKQPACGKTRYIKEMASRKKLRMATVAIQKDTTTETVLTKLRDVYAERDDVREKVLIHFDISAFADTTLVNQVFFYLFVLHRLVSRRGDTLHPVLTDTLLIELPNDGNFVESATQVVPMLSLLPFKEATGTEFDVKTIVMKADGVVVPVPTGAKTLAEVATHFSCTVEKLVETNPSLTAVTKLIPSILLVPPRAAAMTVRKLSRKLNVSATEILKVNKYIPNEEFTVRPGACNGRLATPHISESHFLAFGSKCLTHYHKQHVVNKRSLYHGAAIEKLPIPSSVEISAAIDTLFPKATTKLSRYVAYSAVCAQLTFAFGNDSLYYNPLEPYYNKLEYYIAQLIINTVQNMCASAIPPRNDKNETEASRFARTTSFSEWRSHPFALFSDSGNFSLLTLGSDTSVLLEITKDDPDAGFKTFIKRSQDIILTGSLNRQTLENLCLQLEGPQLNTDALKDILPLICINDRVPKVVLALSSLSGKPQTMPIEEVDNEAVKWLIEFLNSTSGKVTVGDTICIINKWLKTLFIHPGGSSSTPPFLLTPDLLVRKVALKMRMVAGIPAVVSGDQGCGKTLMCEAFARCSGCPYYVLYCNGSVTPSNLRIQMASAIEHAQRSPSTSVIMQLDEGNCLFDNWALHQVMCDRVVDGVFIPPNLLFVVMLNPTKRRTPEQQARFDQINTMGGMSYVSFINDIEVKKSTRNDTTELVYDVSPTPESVLGLGFDFGSAASTFSSTRTYNGKQRMAKYIPLSFDRPNEVSDEMRFASSEVQFMIDRLFEPCCRELLVKAFEAHEDKEGRQLFWPTYRNILVTCLRAMQYWLRETFKGEESVVSLRDIRKVCKLVPFVMRCFLVRHELQEKNKLTCDEVFEFLTKATVCALIMTYYLRLDDDARPKVLEYISVAWKTARNASKGIPSTFCKLPETPQELYGYFDSIAEYAIASLKESDDLAMVTALKENAFLIIVCAKLKMDLFIVGCAGSSKSRALSSVLAASEARCPFFEAIGFDLHLLVLQCTHHTTPADVSRLAHNAARVQNQEKNKCVVLVLEEVGATVKSKHNPLMTLHNIIDHGVDIGGGVHQPICVIGISNWWLAGAKMGRCNVVHRGLPNVEDLKEIGGMILGTQALWLDDFCDAVRTQVLNNQVPEAKVLSRFFGMRDFYNCIKLLKLLLTAMSTRGRKVSNVDINSINRYPHVVRWAITISYGGLPPTPENRKVEYLLYRRLMNSFGRALSENVLATYSWTDNPDSPNGRGIPLCATCAEMAFQRKWLTYVNNLPPRITTQEKEQERMRLFRKHAREQDTPKCEGFHEENTEVPPSAIRAVDIAAFTILHSETRHLMVFGDPCAVVGLLRLHGLLPNRGPYAAGVIFAGEATDERRLASQLRIVKEVMARGGHLVIQGLGLSALLLEPANMHYIRRGDGESSFRTRLPTADGSSKLVPCHPNFRITMIVNEEEAARAPPPVVQRFTKVTLSYLSSMSGVQRETMRRIKEEASIEWGNKTASLLHLLIPGFSDESLAMLIMSVSIRRIQNNEEYNNEDDYDGELTEIMVRLALSFSPDAWARVVSSPESESNKTVISRWKRYFEDFGPSATRNYFLKLEIESVKSAFPHAPHILLLTRQPDPSVHYIHQAVKETLALTEEENDSGDIKYAATVYGNEPNSVSTFTSELERLRDLLIKASSSIIKPRGLLTVLLDLTSVSSAEDLWATFRSSTEQVVNSDEWMLHVIVVATVGDPLLAARTQKELPRLHYTNDWIVLHVDELSPTVMTGVPLREIELKPLSMLCDEAFDAVSEDPESLLVLAQQLSQYAGGELKGTKGVNEWIKTLSDFLKTDLGKAYITRVKRCVQESAETNEFDWKRPALRYQRETLRSTYVRYLMHVIQLALFPGLCYICGSMKAATTTSPDTEWYRIVEENVELFFEVPESFIRCFDYCLQPDELLSERRGHIFENKLPFSNSIIRVLRQVIRNCTDATNMDVLLNDVCQKIPFYEKLTISQREDLYYDTVATLSSPGATFKSKNAVHNSRELLSFFNISSKINNTEWTRPLQGNEFLSALVLTPTDFTYLVTLSNFISKELDLIKKRLILSVDDLIDIGKGTSFLSLDSIAAIRELSGGFQKSEKTINWDWLESLAIAEKSVPGRFLPELDRCRAQSLHEETLPQELFLTIAEPELKPVRLLLCKELLRDLNKPKHLEGWLLFGMTSEKVENSLRYLLIRSWLKEMLKGRSTSERVRELIENESLTTFMTQATYRELEKRPPSDIVKALGIQLSTFPKALQTAMCLGIILAALNYIAKNVGTADTNLVNALNRALLPFRAVNREWLMLFALRQGTSGGAELGGLLPFAQYLKGMNAFKDSNYLAILIEKLEGDKKAKELPKLLESKLLSDVVARGHVLFEMAKPNSIAGWFQARIKEGKLESILLPGITTSLEYDRLVVEEKTYIYSCSKGHKYASNYFYSRMCQAQGCYASAKLLGTRQQFMGNASQCIPTTGFVLTGWYDSTHFRGLTPLQILILSTLSLCAVTSPDPNKVNRGKLESDLNRLLEGAASKIFNNAENQRDAAAEFLIELFTDGAAFFTTASDATSRDTIESLCKKKLISVESCRALGASGTEVISLIRNGSEAQAIMKKAMKEHHEFLNRTPLPLLGYRFLPTPKRLLESAVMRDNRLKVLVFASKSITVKNADDVLQLLKFVREFDEVCERTPELKHGTVDAEELKKIVLSALPVFHSMSHLVKNLDCVQLNKYNFLLQNLLARRFEVCKAEDFLVGQRDQHFIEGLYGGTANNKSSFVVAQNKLMKTLLPERFRANTVDTNERLLKPEEKPVPIRGSMDLLRVDLYDEMLRVLDEYHTDLIQLCPSLDTEAINCYITHLTAHLKLHTLPILPDTCDENIIHNVDKIRNFRIKSVPPNEDVVLYLRWLKEAEPEQILVLSAFIRRLVQLAVTKAHVRHNTPLIELVTQMNVLTPQQRLGYQLFKTTPVFAGCNVEQLFFLSALTWQGSVDTAKFCIPLRDAEGVKKVLKELGREPLWDLFRAVAIFGQFSTSRTDLKTNRMLKLFLGDLDVDLDAFDELSSITVEQLGSFWELLSAEFWSRDFASGEEQRFTAPSIGDLFRASCVELEESPQPQPVLPVLRIPVGRRASTGDGSLTEREARAERHVDAVPHENDSKGIDVLWPALHANI